MSQSTKISREEYQVKKALDGLRKKQTTEPENAEEDKEKEAINPHIPKYLVQAPWYLNQQEQNMDHQKSHGLKTKTDMNQWYERGVKKEAAYKYRKGACENCGAITHKTKDCCERPRKVGAKWTGQDIKPDEHIQQFSMTWDAKRDRWNGYDPNMFNDVFKEHEEFEEARKQLRQEELASGKTAALDDEYMQKMFENNAPVAHKDPRTKTTIRDLRIREDIAGYLLDLNDESARGATNSVKEGATNDMEFEKEDPNRLTGDAAKLLEQEKMVWDLIQQENAEINSVSMPTATEMIYRKIKEKKQQINDERNYQLMQKYGENQSLERDPSLIYAQSERYVEYTREGKIKLDKKKAIPGKSSYNEDILTNDHTSVWGSWWSEEFGWGFNCCYQTVKNSMCLGEKGRKMTLVKEYKLKKAREDQLKGFTKAVGEPEDSIKEEKIITNKVEEPDATQFAMPIAKPTQLGAQQILEENNKQLSKKKKLSAKSSSSSSESSSDASSSDSGSDSKSSKSSKFSKSRSRSKSRDRHLAKKARDKEKKKEEEIDPNKLKKAMEKEKERRRERSREKKGKESKYNSSKDQGDYEVTPEDMEAYKMMKKKFEDPMNKYL